MFCHFSFNPGWNAISISIFSFKTVIKFCLNCKPDAQTIVSNSNSCKVVVKRAGWFYCSPSLEREGLRKAKAKRSKQRVWRFVSHVYIPHALVWPRPQSLGLIQPPGNKLYFLWGINQLAFLTAGWNCTPVLVKRWCHWSFYCFSSFSKRQLQWCVQANLK